VEGGSFDFEGRTDSTRALDRFLDLAEEHDLFVFLRPGPWIYDFFMDGGVPMAASLHHRLDQRFLAEARAYLEALAPVVVPRLATNGGPIVLCQVDNEIEPLATQRGDSGGTRLAEDPVGSSYAGQILDGPLEDPSTLRSHLARQHQSCLAFTRSRGLEPADDWNSLRLGELVRDGAIAADLMDYYQWYCTTYAVAVTEMIREVGIDVPLALNTFTNMEPQSNVEFARIAPLVGGDYWGMNHLPWLTLLQVSRHARHLRAATGTAWSAEYQSVSIAQFVAEGVEDVVSPDNATYLGLLGMLVGLKGWNWYTIAERSSLYFAPINNFGGAVDSYFEPYRQLHHEFAELDWPGLEPVTDAVIWFDRDVYRRQTDFGAPRDMPFHTLTEGRGGAWMAAFDRLHRLDMDLDIHDPEASHNAPTAGRVVIVPEQGEISASAQAALRKLAAAGATLVFQSSAEARRIGPGPGRVPLLSKSASGVRWLEVLAELGAVRAVGAGDGVLTSAWRRGQEVVIVALNTTAKPFDGTVTLNLARLGLDPAAEHCVEMRLSGAASRVPGRALESLRVELRPTGGEIVRIRPRLTERRES
jgi:hypothetical protein